MLVQLEGDDRTTALEALDAGRELAFAEIYARWSPLVYSIALGSLGDVAEAERVTQHVFTEAWSSRQTFASTRDQLSDRLIEITLATIAVAPPTPPDTPRPRTATVSPAGATPPADLARRLQLVDAISRVDSVPQQVFRMALYDALTHVQIAERTGLPAATVRRHLHRVLLALRARLEAPTNAY